MKYNWNRRPALSTVTSIRIDISFFFWQTRPCQCVGELFVWVSIDVTSHVCVHCTVYMWKSRKHAWHNCHISESEKNSNSHTDLSNFRMRQLFGSPYSSAVSVPQFISATYNESHFAMISFTEFPVNYCISFGPVERKCDWHGNMYVLIDATPADDTLTCIYASMTHTMHTVVSGCQSEWLSTTKISHSLKFRTIHTFILFSFISLVFSLFYSDSLEPVYTHSHLFVVLTSIVGIWLEIAMCWNKLNGKGKEEKERKKKHWSN